MQKLFYGGEGGNEKWSRGNKYCTRSVVYMNETRA